MHKYTLHHDDPDFVRAKINAQQISDVRHFIFKHVSQLEYKQMVLNLHAKAPVCHLLYSFPM